MLRSPVVEEISPKVAAPTVCETGLLKIGVLARLNASPRISNHLCSVTANFLPSDRLRITAPGPRTTPGPASPKVDRTGRETAGAAEQQTEREVDSEAAERAYCLGVEAIHRLQMDNGGGGDLPGEVPTLRNTVRDGGAVAEQGALQQALRGGSGAGVRERGGTPGGAAYGASGEHGMSHRSALFDDP